MTLYNACWKLLGKTAWVIGTGVIGLTGGVNVNEASAISWSLLALNPATVTVHCKAALAVLSPERTTYIDRVQYLFFFPEEKSEAIWMSSSNNGENVEPLL